MTETARITVEGEGTHGVPADLSLLEACEEVGIHMESDCGGFATCNACRVCVLAGADGLTAKEVEEDPFLDAPGQRLGCQARLQPGAHVTFRKAPGL